MVYLLRYRQRRRDELTYRRFCEVLDENGFLHEIFRGEILCVPSCQIYILRKRLTHLLADGDDLLIIPVLINDHPNAEARAFVAEQWALEAASLRAQRLRHLQSAYE